VFIIFLSLLLILLCNRLCFSADRHLIDIEWL